MSTEPTIAGLKELLEELNQNELSSQLNEKSFEKWKNRTKGQWERNYGIAGVDIYNYLNPRSEGN